MQFLRKLLKLGSIEGENSAWPKIDVKKPSHSQPRGVIDDGAPSSLTVNVAVYIIGHNYHGHYLHAGGLSVNNYVREKKVREVNVRE